MSERWARCAGFPAYEVSSVGRVRQRHTRRAISAWPNDEGYLYVNLQARGAWFKRRVHKLVWESHRGLVPCGLEVEHRDRKRGNPRLRNLRLARHGHNIANSEKRAGRSSEFKGVTWCASRKCWQGQLKDRGTNYFLGRSKSETKLARLYDRAARKHFGKFAVTNFGRR